MQKDDLLTKVKALSQDIKAVFYSVGHVPIVITDEHNEVYYFWQNLALSKATLLHIDAHGDLEGTVHENSSLSNNYYQALDINNFICPAVHYGLVDLPLYWHNPHSGETLQFGPDNPGAGRIKGTSIVDMFGHPTIQWRPNPRLSSINSYPGELVDSIAVGDQFILDIDLDAFSCSGHVHNMPLRYNGEYGYEERIGSTLAMLRTLPTPTLVTITRSQCGSETYVDPRYVARVEGLILAGLARYLPNSVDAAAHNDQVKP
ncbi:MAG: UPF0489 family protein [Nanoarchaeota archaeon]|nr:UPF0489 family protein [Nanoarchaeota archaeon]MBU1704166.1 UPF0489 family protein [Nanoarchaeota archaeon]